MLPKGKSQWQNCAEKAIQRIKEMSTRILDKSGAPEKYWTLVVLYAAQMKNHSAHPSLCRRTPHERVFGDTPDASVFRGLSFGKNYLVNSVKFSEWHRFKVQLR